MKTVRTHDKIYLTTNRYNKPKKAFEFLYKILKKKLSIKKRYKVLDVGCSNGELLFFLNKKFRNFDFHGVDLRNDLIKLAKNKLPKNITLKKKDYTKETLKGKFDIIIVSGVIGILDELDNFFTNIKKNMKKNSILFLFENLNEYDYDIMIKYKDLNSKITSYQSGWNIWSIKKIKKYFKSKKIIIHPFNIDIDIKQNKNDLIRTWTIKIGKKRYFLNALNILQKQSWFEIR